MKKQKGSVMKTVLVTIAVFGYLLLLWGIITYNGMIRFENKIEAVDKNMQNVHASMFQQMRQQGVAVDKYGSMVIEALEATFGKGGSKAAFQWLQNQGTIPASVIDKLGVAIEAGYNRFEATQGTKIDVVNKYKDATEVFPGNIISVIAGFPRKSWEEHYRILTSAQTKADFESGELSDPGIFNK